MGEMIGGGCNFLMARGNAAVGGIPGAMVSRMGNWVGGRFELTDNGFLFSMNAANRALQRDTADVVIARGDISNPRMGKMFLIFKTVDFDTPYGICRVRAFSATTRKLASALGVAA